MSSQTGRVVVPIRGGCVGVGLFEHLCEELNMARVQLKAEVAGVGMSLFTHLCEEPNHARVMLGCGR